jgi:hypothetical protein
MDTERGAKSSLGKKKHVFLFSFFILSGAIIFLIIFNFISLFGSLSCGDGTLNGDCSLNAPYFCSNGVLIENASFCGCPELLAQVGNSCSSNYASGPKEIQLDYILKGEEYYLDFVVYEGMNSYVENITQYLYYHEDENPSRIDFKLKNLENGEKRELLLPLVVEIQNTAKSKKDQVRIAVSLVQSIPYGSLNETFSFASQEVNFSRYPYEVLYDMKGVCQEKSELLAFLLKEMGYGVVLFYYPEENHEAVGIKCPVKYSLNESGYCFIETTGPSIISDSERYYEGWGRLSGNPEILLVSEGNSLDNWMYEYKDADNLDRFTKLIEEQGGLNVFQHEFFSNLKEKYGLVNI